MARRCIMQPRSRRIGIIQNWRRPQPSVTTCSTGKSKGVDGEHKNGNGNGIEVPIPILNTKLKVTGAAAILAIMLAGAAYWTYDQVKQRDEEMEAIRAQIRQVEKSRQAQLDQMMCKLDLAMFLYTFPKGGVDWSAIPPSMYGCMPAFKVK